LQTSASGLRIGVAPPVAPPGRTIRAVAGKVSRAAGLIATVP
jgi:hypothetical protein